MNCFVLSHEFVACCAAIGKHLHSRQKELLKRNKNDFKKSAYFDDYIKKLLDRTAKREEEKKSRKIVH